jgi:hypothetical protein
MEEDIRLMISSCMPCLQRKSCGAPKLPPMQFSVTGYPFEKIAIDIAGPLPLSKNGERYLLGIVDYFSKYPMLLPIKNMESKTVAEAIFTNWICTFGVPDVIHSDRGTSFESELFHELCQLTGVRKTKTAPYYPQSDGLIERLFRTVKDMIYATTQTYNRDWRDILPIVAMGLRSSVQRSIGVSPFEVIFGHTMRTPLQWRYPIPATLKSSANNISEYVLDLKERLKRVHQLLRQHNSANKEKRSDGTNTCPPWKIDDIVMAKILPTIKGVDMPRYYGPFVIIERLGSWTYRLKHKVTEEVIDRNIHHLKKMNSNSMAIQPAKKTTFRTTAVSHKSHTFVPTVTNSFSNLPNLSVYKSTRLRHAPLRYGFC